MVLPRREEDDIILDVCGRGGRGRERRMSKGLERAAELKLGFASR